MPEAPADFCLECGYRLTGLPARHRCPECGTPYDEHIRVWKPARTFPLFLEAVLPAVGAVLMLSSATRHLRQRYWWGTLAAGFLVCVTAVVLWKVGSLMLDRRRTGFRVTLTRDGIGVYTQEQSEVVAWKDLNGVGLKRSGWRSDMRILIYSAARSYPIEIRFVISSRVEAAQFKRAVAQARKQYYGHNHSSREAAPSAASNSTYSPAHTAPPTL